MRNHGFCNSTLAATVGAAAFAAMAFVASPALASGTSTVTVSLMPACTIVQSTDLAFGRFVPGVATGNIGVTPAGVRSVVSGDAVLVLGAPVTAASFTVSGGANTTYAITAPSPFSITSGANTMSVNTVTTSPSATGTLSAGGTQVLTVGAYLQVTAAQAFGDYTGTFNVTVAYN